MIIEDVDRRALLEVVRDFATSEIGPLVERPESAMSPESVATIVDRLTSLGVLTAEGERGFGVWDSTDDPESCRMSVQVLGEIARVSPAIAYEVHARALAAALDHAAGGFAQHSTATFEASSGVSGRPTGRALAGEDLSSDDVPVVVDAWGAPHLRPRLHIGAPGWEQLWWPEWSRDGWRLCRASSAEVATETLARGHGFDELSYMSCTLTSPTRESTAVLGRAETVDAFAVYAIGLLAISVSTARRPILRAREFSGIRVQGGDLIGRHDAVAQLLARAEQAVMTSEALLNQVTAAPPGLHRLHQVWRARTHCQPLLSAAGSDALQVFGGIGYMRDLGVEKDQRDLNTMRRLGGSPSELALRCAALDETSRRVA